jgi:dipeptidyl aminopeptidase/acylaminoacyl peptidase
MRRPACLVPIAALLAASVPAAAGAPGPAPRAAGYDQPAQAILDVLHAPSPPRPYVSPAGDTILLVSFVDYPAMEQVAEPFLRLAGVRVEPRTRRKRDTPGGYGLNPCARDAQLVRVATGAATPLALPSGCVESPRWAPDGSRFVFTRTAGDAVELWVGLTATGAVRRVGNVRVNPMLGTATLQWLPGSKAVLAKLVPANAGPAPVASVADLGPSIQETNGEKGESSTYETRDTLQNKHDEDLFDYYAAAQLAVVDTDTGRATPLGKPAIYDDVDVAPDGEHVLVETIHKPYSYVTTYDRFPREVEIWSRASGAAMHKIASLPLADRVPVHGVPVGPRDFAWRATAPATLVWAEALDGGDWNAKVPARDKVMMQAAPFAGTPAELVRTEQRFAGLTWGEDPSVALLRDYDENKHWTRAYAFDADHPAGKPRLIFDRSTDDHYRDPGAPVMRELPDAAWVMRGAGAPGAIYLSGAGSSPDGDRPFLDRFDLGTRKGERLFRSEKTAYEQFLAFIGTAPPFGGAAGRGQAPTVETNPGRAFLTWHESTMDPPNAFERTLGAALAGAPAGEAAVTSSARQITRVTDPTPQVRAIKKRLVTYKRKDGMPLSFTLYTPPGYVEGTRIPAILYAYPLDYADTTGAGQVTGSTQRFTRLAQYRLLLLAGYAIIDNAAFPIVGDPKRAYDHYLEQLVDDATAAVHEAVAIGVADPARIGVTGHSHGALMTVNLLAHSTLFRAGVATSGSYNKTLTPFGFQNERRSVWEAQSVYLKASPFFSADTLKLPLLIVHGADDANPGTTPLQATKLYEALRGNGGIARLVMLPHEPHWYTAMESQEQLAYEMIRWFDTYVKNAPPPSPRAR